MGARRAAVTMLAVGALGLAGARADASDAASAAARAPTPPVTAAVAQAANARLPLPPPPRRGRIAEGVSIDGLDVSGLTGRQARRAVLVERVAPKRRPLVLVIRGRRVPLRPVRAGYVADVDYAVRAALNFGRSHALRRQVDVPLRERVSHPRIRAILRRHARRLDVAPRDASIRFSGSRPIVRRARAGVRLRVGASERIAARAVLERRRSTHRLPTRRVRPAVSRVPTAVLIERSRFRLTLFQNGRRARTFGVAVGQPAFPTPAGAFHIVTKQRNPTWFPPSSPWAAGLGPVPPGVNNPLGTRWMGTSASAIGIHGTPQPGSIGSAASHGCIRMRISEAEYLYDRIDIGTTVRIV